MAFDFGTNSLVSSETFSAYCGLDDTLLSPTEKIRTEFCVKAITSLIRKHCGSYILASNYIESWDGQGSDLIIPREIPIISVSSISFSLNGDFSNSLLLESNEYSIDPTSGVITLRNIRTPRGRSVVKLEYVAGYVNVPEDIQMALCMQYDFISGSTRLMPGLSEIGKMNERQKKDDSVAETGMPSEVTAILRCYKRMEAPLSVMFARVS